MGRLRIVSPGDEVKLKQIHLQCGAILTRGPLISFLWRPLFSSYLTYDKTLLGAELKTGKKCALICVSWIFIERYENILTWTTPSLKQVWSFLTRPYQSLPVFSLGLGDLFPTCTHIQIPMRHSDRVAMVTGAEVPQTPGAEGKWGGWRHHVIIWLCEPFTKSGKNAIQDQSEFSSF